MHLPDAPERPAAIIPINFWIDYAPQDDGTIKEYEMVEWARKGTQGSTTQEKVLRLQKHDRVIWDVIKPHYEAWKRGAAAPIDGTPLAAWPGANPPLVKILANFNIKSVEDLADLTDATLAKVPLPNMRVYVKNAKAFVAAQQTTSVVAGQIIGLEKSNEVLQAQLKDAFENIALLKERLNAGNLNADQEAVAEAPKKRGRPFKSVA
jgi:hypothetical protein